MLHPGVTCDQAIRTTHRGPAGPPAKKKNPLGKKLPPARGKLFVPGETFFFRERWGLEEIMKIM